jgi:hypothetical protein
LTNSAMVASTDLPVASSIAEAASAISLKLLLAITPLPVRDHEDVAGTGQGQGHMQRQTGSGRPEEDILVARHHDKSADSDRRIDQLTEDAVSDLPTQYAPGRSGRDKAAGDGVDQFKIHGGLPPPNRWRMSAQRSAALMARLIAARSEPPNVPSRKPIPATIFGSVTFRYPRRAPLSRSGHFPFVGLQGEGHQVLRLHALGGCEVWQRGLCGDQQHCIQ